MIALSGMEQGSCLLPVNHHHVQHDDGPGRRAEELSNFWQSPAGRLTNCLLAVPLTRGVTPLQWTGDRLRASRVGHWSFRSADLSNLDPGIRGYIRGGGIVQRSVQRRQRAVCCATKCSQCLGGSGTIPRALVRVWEPRPAWRA